MFLDNDKSKTATSIAGFTVFLTAVCAMATLACSYAQGLGFAKGLKDALGGKNPDLDFKPRASATGSFSYGLGEEE